MTAEAAEYKTILVAFDNSDFSRAALIEAANWVKRHGGKVVMVHAAYFDEENFANVKEQIEKHLEIGRRMCYQTRENFSLEFGIEIQSLVCEGEPPAVIVETAKSENADLIVMGTYGRRGLKRLIVGSVTSHVIADSPCDVLIVKKPCTECTGAYRSILIPYDGSEFSRKALGRACQISKTDNADITALYVIPRYEEMMDFFKTSSIKKSLQEEAEKIINTAKGLAIGQGLTIKTAIVEGHTADRIIETSERLKNDLIVIGTYGWRGVNKAIMGSTTERVIINALCPILVVR